MFTGTYLRTSLVLTQQVRKKLFVLSCNARVRQAEAGKQAQVQMEMYTNTEVQMECCTQIQIAV